MFDLLKATFGILLVMGVWLAIQAFVRRRTNCSADQDVLEHMAHGCAGCNGAESCRNIDNRDREGALDKEKHDELV